MATSVVDLTGDLILTAGTRERERERERERKLAQRQRRGNTSVTG